MGNLNLSALERRVAWVGCLENALELLQSLASGFNKEKVDEGDLDADPADVHKVQFPPNLLHADRDTVCVDHHGNVEEKEVGT